MDFPLSSLPMKTVTKPQMAVLAGPTRSFSGWALAKLGKLSRPARRFIILQAGNLLVCATDNPRSALLTQPVLGAVMTSTSSRNECLIRSTSNRIWLQWPTEAELRLCRLAFEYANRRIEDYYKLVTHRQLGKGRASEVVFGFDTTMGDHAAIKILNKDKAKTTEREFAEKEVRIRMAVQHSCLVQTLDIFETPYDLFIVMELMSGGPIDRRMIKQGAPLAEHEARVVMRRLFEALAHLHSLGIAHRNVKPQNLFLDFSDDARWADTTKLSDFSLACLLDEPDSFLQVVGTPEYLAPEATLMSRTVDGDREVIFGTEIDMWAAGVTLYNLLTMELPFEGEYPPEVFKKARVGKINLSTESFRHITPEAKSLVRALLNVDRRKRPTAQTVLLHPWFEEATPEPFPGELADEANALTLSNKLAGMSEGLFKLRAVALSVVVLLRLQRLTPGIQIRESIRREKRFQFHVSGINIAPALSATSAELAAATSIDGKGEVLLNSPRAWTSNTMMSRVSTGSTVKSRSSVGNDSLSGAFLRGSPNLRSMRTDGADDYFGRSDRFMNDSFGRGNVDVQRLMSDTAAVEDDGRGSSKWWRRRK